MSRINTAIVIFWVIFVIPFAVYFIGNFYFWMFANGSPDIDRMIASVTALILTLPCGVMFGLENWE
jgi:cation transport ATPase